MKELFYKEAFSHRSAADFPIVLLLIFPSFCCCVIASA